MKKHTFVIVAYAPEDIASSEVADHLAEASRRLSADLHATDPMARLADLKVYGMVRAADLPSPVHHLPRTAACLRD